MAGIVFTGGLPVGAVAKGAARRAGCPVGVVPVFTGIGIGTSRYRATNRGSTGIPTGSFGAVAEACIILSGYGVGTSFRRTGGRSAAVASPIITYGFIGAGSIRTS